MNTKVLSVTVASPQNVLFSGKATSISSKNSAGPFDLLPEHASFITIIENSPIIVRKQNSEKITFRFPLAIIYIRDDKVSIYTKLQPPEI